MLRTAALSLRTLTSAIALRRLQCPISIHDSPPPILRSSLLSAAPQASAALRRLAPLGDRVLVKRVVQEAKTAGGIFLPDTGKKLNEGEVR